MPMVIKRDQLGKDPKSKDANGKAAPATKPAAKSSTKAPGGTKKKGAKDAPNETPKLIILGVVTVVSLSFLLWYFVFAGGPDSSAQPGPADQVPRTTATATAAPGGQPGQAPKGNVGGFSTDEGAAASGKMGLGRKTEGADPGGEGIP